MDLAHLKRLLISQIFFQQYVVVLNKFEWNLIFSRRGWEMENNFSRSRKIEANSQENSRYALKGGTDNKEYNLPRIWVFDEAPCIYKLVDGRDAWIDGIDLWAG